MQPHPVEDSHESKLSDSGIFHLDELSAIQESGKLADDKCDGIRGGESGWPLDHDSESARR